MEKSVPKWAPGSLHLYWGESAGASETLPTNEYRQIIQTRQEAWSVIKV